MLILKTKKELASDAHTFASNLNLIRYKSTTYMPVDYETMEATTPMDVQRRVWVPLLRPEMQSMTAELYDTLFASDADLRSYEFMVAQNAEPVKESPAAILIRTEAGLRELLDDGSLVESQARFIPNYIKPILNEDQAVKAEVWGVLVDWVGAEDEATSLLYHLATCLAPGYSAVKYVLLLGEGRNGKGLLIKMLQGLFGIENVSHVSRQYMSELNPTVTDLNGKLLNLVFDGSSDFIKDSGPEKTLVAGEPISVRQLYESHPTIVQTNALFVEALNQEPKSRDKSQALQKRLARFRFDKVFTDNRAFQNRMLSDEVLGAFLALLIEHYVPENRLAERLAPTQGAAALQQEHQLMNSIPLQYLEYVDTHGTLGIEGLVGQTLEEVLEDFLQWRASQGGRDEAWTTRDMLRNFKPYLDIGRKSVRRGTRVTKQQVIKGLLSEAEKLLGALKEEEDERILETLVDD